MHFLVTVAVLLSAPPSGGAGARRAEATAALEAAERARGADVIEEPIAAALAGWTAERNLAFFGRGAQRVADGRRALARVELDQAAARLAEAEQAYAHDLWRPGAALEAAEAAKWHGVALFELKRRDEAVDAWRRAKTLDPAAQLTEAMVRPEVARAFAAAKPERDDSSPPIEGAGAGAAVAPGDLDAQLTAIRQLGADEVLVAAIAIDAGVLTWAATRRERDCGTQTLTSTRAEDLVRRLHEEPCRAGAPVAVLEAPAIAHPRAAPSTGPRVPERRERLWQRPWLWVGVVGALGVGVVLAVSLWPRDASYSLVADFHSFALGGR